MRFPPPSVIASWPVANYDDPVTRGPTVMIVELSILPFALACVILRLWIRIRWLRKGWWDDWLMVVAMVCFRRYISTTRSNYGQFFSCGTTILVILGKAQRCGRIAHDLT
jgi:hypothetical protein